MIPHPNELFRDLVVMVELFHRDYEEAYGYSHDHRDRPTNEQNERVSGSRLANPTMAIGLDNQRRRSLGRVGRDLYGFTTKDDKRVKGVIDRLKESRTRLDGIFTPPPEEWEPLESVIAAGSINDQNRAKTPELKFGERQQRKRQLLKEVELLEEIAGAKRKELRKLK